MAKVIITNIKGSPFLIETDDSVEIPHELIIKNVQESEKKSDFQEVVSIEKINEELNGLKQLIVACCDSLFEAFESIPRPEKFSIEFGIKLAGELGVPMLTKSSAEANFKINIEWKKTSDVS